MRGSSVARGTARRAGRHELSAAHVPLRCWPVVLPPLPPERADSAGRDPGAELALALRAAQGDDRLVRRCGGRHPFDDDGLVARRRHQLEVLDRHLLDALRGAQRLDFQAQVAIDLFFTGAFALEALHLVAVQHQLQRLPGGEQHDQHEHGADSGRAPQLPLPLLVDLPDDRVVANVLLDRVFEIKSAPDGHASLSMARSFALRARGLRSISASPGTIGRLVSTWSAARPCASARKACFTMRSSSEWNVITTRRAPASSRLQALARNSSSCSSSRFTQMRSAWNVRVAGSMR